MNNIETMIRDLVRQEVNDSVKKALDATLQDFVQKLASLTTETTPTPETVFEKTPKKIKTSDDFVTFTPGEGTQKTYAGMRVNGKSLVNFGGGFRFQGTGQLRRAVFLAGLHYINEDNTVGADMELSSAHLKKALWGAGVPKCTANVNRIDASVRWANQEGYLTRKKGNKNGKFRLTAKGHKAFQKTHAKVREALGA